MPMSIDIILILISIALSLYGSYNYIYDTIKGTTRPNRVSQGLWAIAPLIGVGAAISSGADCWRQSQICLQQFLQLKNLGQIQKAKRELRISCRSSACS
jgi:hypothetical protein